MPTRDLIENCGLCDPSLGPLVSRSRHWLLVVNLNQNLLGKTFLVLRRHLVAVSELSGPEWVELHEQLACATKALSQAFGPVHFNYAFLQNQDRHIHLHLIPRYDGPVRFGGCVFEDPDYPAHYSVPAPQNRVPEETLARIAGEIRIHLE